MKLSSVQQAEQARNLLLNKLRKHDAVSLEEFGLNNSEPNLSHRSFKEAAWKLVEEGKAQFNSTWDLEIL